MSVRAWNVREAGDEEREEGAIDELSSMIQQPQAQSIGVARLDQPCGELSQIMTSPPPRCRAATVLMICLLLCLSGILLYTMLPKSAKQIRTQEIPPLPKSAKQIRTQEIPAPKGQRGDTWPCTTQSWTQWVKVGGTMGNGSVSVTGEIQKYGLAVKRANTDDVFFKEQFKQYEDEGYSQVVASAGATHVPVALLDRLRKQDPEALQGANLAGIMKHNTIGGPRLEFVSGVGMLSASMVKYATQASDMGLLFGSLNGFSVVEIGVGYGGLAHTLMTRWKLSAYVFVDLLEVEMLTQKYLHHIGTPDTTRLIFPDIVARRTPAYTIAAAGVISHLRQCVF